jgi:hypothetical protein
MPRAPKKCGRATCETRVAGGRSYCDVHQAEVDARVNTTQRGYGSTHQHTRRSALAALVPGTRCPHCRLPMDASQSLDLDHTPDRAGYRGLAHSRCNARDGRLTQPTQGLHPHPGPP